MLRGLTCVALDRLNVVAGQTPIALSVTLACRQHFVSCWKGSLSVLARPQQWQLQQRLGLHGTQLGFSRPFCIDALAHRALQRTVCLFYKSLVLLWR